MALSPAPASRRSSARPNNRAANGWMMSTDCSLSNGTFFEDLKIAPVSTRSSSSSMTKRVKYQLMKPAKPANRTAKATTGKTQLKAESEKPVCPLPSGTTSRARANRMASKTIQPRMNGVSGCGRSVCLTAGAGRVGVTSWTLHCCAGDWLIALKGGLRPTRSTGRVAGPPPRARVRGQLRSIPGSLFSDSP